MKLNKLIAIAFCFVPLALISCAGGSSIKQPAENAPATSTEAQPAQVETATQPANTATAVSIKTGKFESGEHPTQGGVRVVNGNGQAFLELNQEFMTSDMGPDLVVILHRSDNVLGSTKPPAYSLKEGDYVILAPLQKFSGAQQYTIPASVDLSKYQSAAIWCRKFNATFGAAKLTS